MARDYKDRGLYSRRNTGKGRDPGYRSVPRESNARWFIIAALVASFAIFLGYLKFSKSENPPQPPVEAAKKAVAPEETKKTAKVEKTSERVEPKFDFYTILPEGEVVVPEHEIKTRIREELVGKVKATQYILQAGSFRDAKDAEKLKAELLAMGIVSKLEKAKVGEVIWHRVKLGPYAQLASVETVKNRLRKSNLDVIITEVSK